MPIDRHYIETFLRQCEQDVSGRVLEIGDDNYSKQFGADRITVQDVLHIHPGNPRATFVGDLAIGERRLYGDMDIALTALGLHPLPLGGPPELCEPDGDMGRD